MAEQEGRPTMAELLDAVDSLAARRPVAARLVAMTDDDSVGSRELAATLSADVSLTARVLKLANSAYFGLGGRVRTVTFAVTVVGFSTIRTMAATAAAGLDSDELLPGDFWPRSKATALAASEFAPLFKIAAPDAFCLGLLAGLGQAVLVQHDPVGYGDLLAEARAQTPRAASTPGALVAGAAPWDGPDRSGVVRAEVERYGVSHTEVSAAVLSSWAFPTALAQALHQVDSTTGTGSSHGACLASSIEVASRLMSPHAPARDVLTLSRGAITEDRVHALLPRLGQEVLASDW